MNTSKEAAFRKKYIKPELTKHQPLREVTMVPWNRGQCTSCTGPNPQSQC